MNRYEMPLHMNGDSVGDNEPDVENEDEDTTDDKVVGVNEVEADDYEDTEDDVDVNTKD